MRSWKREDGMGKDGGGPSQQQDPAPHRFCRASGELHLFIPKSLILDFSKPKQQIPVLGGSCCRADDGTELDACCDVLLYLYSSHSLPILCGGCQRSLDRSCFAPCEPWLPLLRLITQSYPAPAMSHQHGGFNGNKPIS